jgi:hypothetical protein
VAPGITVYSFVAIDCDSSIDAHSGGNEAVEGEARRNETQQHPRRWTRRRVGNHASALVGHDLPSR